MENQDYWICPECGYENENYYIICTACGYEDNVGNEKLNHKYSAARDGSDNDASHLFLLILAPVIVGVQLILQKYQKYINEIPEYFSSYDFSIDVLFLYLGWLVLDGIKKERLSYMSQFWPTTHGKLKYIEVQKREPFSYGPFYVPFVKYEYSVNGRTYTSERISFSGCLGSYQSKDAYRELLFLERNDKLIVYYKPDNPKVSVLKPGFDKAENNIYLIGLFVFLVLYFLVKLLRVTRCLMIVDQ